MNNDEKLLPPGSPNTTSGVVPGVPSQKAQSWGALISIVVIMLMIIIGAFYAWGERIAQNNAYLTTATSSPTY